MIGSSLSYNLSNQTEASNENIAGLSSGEPKQAQLAKSTPMIENVAAESVKATLAQIYEIAKSTVKNVIDPSNLKMKSVLETEKISWNMWFRDFKKLLIHWPLLECQFRNKGSRPTLQHTQAVREILAEKYSALFGFGVLYDTKKHKTAYDVNAEK